MNYLKDILASESILTQTDFENYIGRMESCRPLGSPLELLNKESLCLDDEDRIYDSNVNISDKILNVRKLKIQNSSSIKIRDSIICGDLHISQKEKKKTEIVLDYCIVLGRIVVTGLEGDEDSISLTRVNCKELCLNVVRIKNVSISFSHPLLLSIWDSAIEQLQTFKNVFDFIDIQESEIAKCHFDFRQIIKQNLRSHKQKEAIEKARENFNAFDYSVAALEPKDRKSELSNRESLLFLMNQTTIKSSRADYSFVVHQENLSKYDGLLARSLMRLSGSLIRPARILAIALIVLVGYAAAYTFPWLTFNINANQAQAFGLSFSEALYFSGITFTTIGYGDISPVGWTRALAVSEGIFGVLFLSAFLVSMVRRFCD
jgi:hypothetical protein